MTMVAWALGCGILGSIIGLLAFFTTVGSETEIRKQLGEHTQKITNLSHALNKLTDRCDTIDTLDQDLNAVESKLEQIKELL